MEKIVFLHIEKAAGSSVRIFFYSNFGRNNVYWHGVNDKRTSFLSFPIVGGHKSMAFYDDLVSNKTLFLGILRNPRDRVISLYNYYKEGKSPIFLENNPDFDSNSLENTLNNCRSFIAIIQNGQCNYVSGYPLFEETLEKMNHGNYLIGILEDLGAFKSFLNNKLMLSQKSFPISNIGAKGYKSQVIVNSASEEIISQLTKEDEKLYAYVRKSCSGVYKPSKPDIWQEVLRLVNPLKSDAEPSEYLGELLCSECPSELNKGERFALDVEVRNSSADDWINKKGDLKISYHWLNDKGEVYSFEGKRFPVEIEIIKANSSYKRRIDVYPPKIQGQFTLQLTMIKEGFAWLEKIGFSSKKIEFVVY